ncbi:hypothetical protein K435DRAFT_967042 [Dendrothele bispora CBS 962.96]|uniref:Uncharacterized protein n=1 Tax=Dendrothele bispora (strain CBS 962.96) TaxID=1314807 RepID=A0A4S8LXU4_DENBC|nr:hypothetical protein K435DRAFT_967042 [Dendrothele bispora CBS 962.96]
MSAFGEGGFNFKRYLKATECTSFRISQALEARIRGHPATNVTEDENVEGLGQHVMLVMNKLTCLTDLWVRFSNAFVPTSQSSTGKRSSFGTKLSGPLLPHRQRMTQNPVEILDPYPNSIHPTNLPNTRRQRRGLSRHRSNRKTSQTSQALMLPALYQQQRRYASRWREEWEFRSGREEHEKELPFNTDLTDVSATLPEDTFVDKEEDVPERYFEICGWVDSDFIEGEESEDRLQECEVGNELLEELEERRNGLPEHLIFRAEDGHDDDRYSDTQRKHYRRAIGLSHVFWGHVRSILGIPFLLCKVSHSTEVAQNHNRSSLPEPIANLAAESLKSAKSILEILADLGR